MARDDAADGAGPYSYLATNSMAVSHTELIASMAVYRRIWSFSSIARRGFVSRTAAPSTVPPRRPCPHLPCQANRLHVASFASSACSVRRNMHSSRNGQLSRQLVFRHIQSNAHSEIDCTKDYNYNLGELSGASSHKVDLTSDGFKWPESVDTTADTAFLEITLTHTPKDVPCPSIRATTSANESATHYMYFEHDARGCRHLDLSQLLPLGPGDEVELSSDTGTTWQTNGGASLTTFSNPPIEDKRVLVLSPHPDDAEIAAYGLYTSSNAQVVTLTAGDAGKPKFGSLWDERGEQYRAKGKIRTIDSLTVPLLGGLRPEAVRNLGYYDGTLADMQNNPFDSVRPKFAELEEPGYFRSFNFCPELRNRAFESSWRNLVADILIELETFRPDIVVTTHPWLDSHLDHQFSTLALVDALKRWNQHCAIYLYTNHASGNEMYPFGPRDGMMGLPPWADGRGVRHCHCVDGLYSHPLPKETQRQKLVALEAHHDLRPFNIFDGSEVIEPPPGLNYYRRGGRPNELFYVSDFAGVWAMCQQLLTVVPNLAR